MNDDLKAKALVSKAVNGLGERQKMLATKAAADSRRQQTRLHKKEYAREVAGIRAKASARSPSQHARRVCFLADSRALVRNIHDPHFATYNDNGYAAASAQDRSASAA